MTGFGVPLAKSLDHRGANLVLNLPGHAGVGIGNEADVALGQIWRFEPFLLARHMHQNHQQAADVALGDGRREIELVMRRCDVHGVS